ncbi:MAG: chromosome segregation protein SMC, partial [Methylocystaceae bacterium]
IDARRQERDDLASRLAEARVETARLFASRDSLCERLRVVDEALAPFLRLCDLEVADLDRNLGGATRRLEQKGEDYREARLRAERIESLVAELAQRLAGSAAEARAAAETAASRQRNADDRRKLLEELRGRRDELLGGESTASHRTRHNEARLAAQQARDTAAQRRSEAASAKAGADRDLANAAEALETARASRERTASALATALAASRFDETTALALLTVSADERASLRERIDAAEKSAAAAKAEMDARARDLAEAIAVGRPDEDVATLEARRAQAEQALESLARRLGEIAAEIGADDAARTKAASLSADIAAADAEHKTWAEIDAAIGSATGDKFRRFAQSVTLDHLVALANRHLSALSSRYRLERSAGETADLGLQIVDRDLGDERRSTRSLSGGERFLASLALALGLCSLEGRGSFVDTLFIDEGFGTLDATTLDIAIDALEALQGQGRKVGLISHVESLRQRIPVQIRVEKRGGGRSAVRVDARAIGIG